MRPFLVPRQSGRDRGAPEYSLTVGDACERHRIEAREGVERVALDLRALDGRVQELQVEERVVPDEDRARAIVFLELLADFLEQTFQRFFLIERRAQRMERVDARDLERSGFELRPREGLDEIAMVLAEGSRSPASFWRTNMAATSRSASVAGLKPPVSTSTTTGRNPRKRCEMVLIARARPWRAPCGIVGAGS